MTAVRPLTLDDAVACDGVIRSLPHHFGNEKGRAQCADAVRSQAGLAAVVGGAVVGFLTWQPWFEACWEITWLAVHADHRGRGLGTRLVDRFAALARDEQMRFLLVTTLSPSDPEPGVSDGYARTRAFYGACGFVPIWEPHGWWSEHDQAVVLIRSVT